jgi:hypothetical protein
MRANGCLLRLLQALIQLIVNRKRIMREARSNLLVALNHVAHECMLLCIIQANSSTTLGGIPLRRSHFLEKQ